MNATARYLGVLVGSAVDVVMLLALEPANGIFLNALYYLSLILWLWRAPYGEKVKATRSRGARPGGCHAYLGRYRPPAAARLDDVARRCRICFRCNGYQAQMSNFAHDLGHGNPGTAYSMLLAADAASAPVAGFLLEAWAR